MEHVREGLLCLLLSWGGAAQPRDLGWSQPWGTGSRHLWHRQAGMTTLTQHDLVLGHSLDVWPPLTLSRVWVPEPKPGGGPLSPEEAVMGFL